MDTVSCEVNASSDANTDTSTGPSQSEIGRGSRMRFIFISSYLLPRDLYHRILW